MNFYYHTNPEDKSMLSLEESAHVVKVLRAKTGDQIALMDGLGHSYLVEITDPNPRKCTFKIIEKTKAKAKCFRVHLAIAPTKSVDRLEWFVEKACEMGVDEISIIQTQRTERKKVNHERLEKKAISAMKQSKNFWKCQVNELKKLKDFVNSQKEEANKYVAYVETGTEDLLQKKLLPKTHCLILIGPEGDFSPEEIDLLKNAKFEMVSLGKNVLRTETAGVAAVHTVNLINQ
ncbi:16S rRNA (uracil(1498)-N(3))-methyltransferase [Reichenbachiella carrageenanivorans]|uniref:Ribosomal RNA small subunit methyltransferase E n=1 Tax=Reichenbachiella carrageenanivorans TaxID=2979869 RepID=A0ABY6CXT8_9BACT|nr:RsmE family RNA methyltransferase [Reichenbachiella carrageenanivorans]UXX78722.1 16S rRNA (uracil(1498)-N(3))-methyltransferase [Reichenbachiella carrageenanivorans]